MKKFLFYFEDILCSVYNTYIIIPKIYIYKCIISNLILMQYFQHFNVKKVMYLNMVLYFLIKIY